ncbi:MAG: hypothetical protein NTZ59_11685 [Bacteroidetes bacterium]|nr:hypothetical protein [Bacteroidota bacterium]
MILGFKQKFDDGTPTNFKEKILSGQKIHTLRESNRFKAGMALHMAYGVRTKHYQQFNKDIDNLSTCVSVQEVFMTIKKWGVIEITIDDDKYLHRNKVEALIRNDGLTYIEFVNWFFPKDKDTWKGYIIHWTDFKY